jgi:hypothetical protein
MSAHRIVRVGLLVGAFVASSSAAFADDLIRRTHATTQGCLIRWADGRSSASDEEMSRWFAFSWSGPCQKGKLANGNGTLSFRTGPAKSSNNMGKERFFYSGRLVNGALDGPVHFWVTGSKFAGDNGTKIWVMGCEAWKKGDPCAPDARPRRSK